MIAKDKLKALIIGIGKPKSGMTDDDQQSMPGDDGAAGDLGRCIHQLVVAIKSGDTQEMEDRFHAFVDCVTAEGDMEKKDEEEETSDDEG